MANDLEARRAELKATIESRLAKVRGALTDAQFDQLIADVVRTAERFAEIEKKPGAKTPASRTNP